MDPAAQAVAKKLGDRVRSHRGQIKDQHGRALSQEAFAERSGLDRAYVSRVERGTANITIYTMVRIAEALEVDPSVLVEGLRP